ncbi:hypothetical protein [Sulfurimonas sp.]|uniref:hypothetical protein n=1 Tax=Sulfurimonas sp. TaxID=2022749 RepID=UPI003565CD63
MDYIYRLLKGSVMKKDYCTAFPEVWRGIKISSCCRLHDMTCSTSKFFGCLKKKLGIFHATYITLGGAIGCWAKYTSKMFKRV